MSEDSGDDVSLTLLAGENRTVLCIWDTGVVRSVREARLLASAGCEHNTVRPGPSLATFLDAYRSSFETLLGPARFERGRIVVETDADGSWVHMHAVQELARELGLSCHDGSAFVYVTLNPTNTLALAAMLRLVIAGDVAHAMLSDGCWTLHLDFVDGSLQAGATGLDPHMRRALRLLGFSDRGVQREAFRLLEPLPFPASRLLQRVLLQGLVAQDCAVEARLTSGCQLASTAELPTALRKPRRELRGVHVATESRDPSST